MISLRTIQESDLAIFFEQQLDAEAVRMAAFPARDLDAFMVHWQKIMADDKVINRTIDFGGQVAGNIVCWEQSGEWKVGYWLGKEFWGQGIASAALRLFLPLVQVRPLHASVASHNQASIRVLQKCGFVMTGADRFLGPDGAECGRIHLHAGVDQIGEVSPVRGRSAREHTPAPNGARLAIPFPSSHSSPLASAGVPPVWRIPALPRAFSSVFVRGLFLPLAR